MENKFINLYNTFCKSLSNLAKSKTADPKTDFVLEGTVLNFSLTFDISWKVMKDILIKKGNSWFCSWLSTRNSAAGIYQWYYWWWHLAANAEIQKSFVSWLRWYFRRREISGYYKYLLSSFWKIQKRCCEIL